jgi:hypothetical protein
MVDFNFFQALWQTPGMPGGSDMNGNAGSLARVSAKYSFLVIRLTVIGVQPTAETTALPGVRVEPTPLLVGVYEIIRIAAFHNGIRCGDGHNGVIREEAVITKQREVLGFDIVPFGDASYDVANNRAEHDF